MTYLAVFVTPGHMRLAFFAVDLNTLSLLGPGVGLAAASEAGVPGLGAAVLVFEDDDE